MSVATSAIPAERRTPGGPGPQKRPGLTPLWTLYVLTLRRHQHGRRWMVMSLLLLLPAGLALLVRSTAPDVPGVVLELTFAFMFIPQALLPLLALIYASGIMQDEQEEQTLSYLLVRPMAKWAIYGVKLLATLTTTALLSTLFTVLAYVVVYAGTPTTGESMTLRCAQACVIHALAVAAYCCLFGLIGVLIKRVLVAGIIYIAVVEGLLANLPFGIRFITVIYHARLIAYRSLPFLVRQPPGRGNFTSDVAAEAWQLDIRNDPQLLEHPSRATCVAVLVLGSVACAFLAAWVCSRREFHVKTPEKA